MNEENNLPCRYSKLSSHGRRRVKEKYIELQNNKCWYCKEDIYADPPQRILDKPITLYLYPKGFLNSPIHLQHDHNTDMTEGAVHGYCNAVLWEYEGK
jgi:hypothetical protein